MLFSEQLLAMLSSKMALCTLTKIFWNILDNSSVFVCFCGGYRTLSHNPISFTLVISKINGERLPWALPSRRTARPPRSARVPVCTRSDIFPWCFHCLSTLETRGTKKQDQPWASGLQLLAPLLGFCLGSKGWRQQNMGKQPNNQNWVSKGDVSPCINWFTINFSPFSDVSPRFFSLLDGLLGINDLPHFFCCRELGPGETYDLCSIMYNTLYIYIL